MEKKILAISELEFSGIVSTTLIGMLSKVPESCENVDEYMGNKLGEFAGRVHEKLFSDKYVIGKKKCRRSSGNANSGISKTTSIFYHETANLSRGNEK